jgi:putative ABC transport system ATP-binding protein
VASAALVEVTDLEKSYEQRGRTTHVLRGASFSLARGTTTSLVGTSGAGKSTLLAIVAGLMLPNAGAVRFDGELVTELDETGRAALRARRIGVVMQSDNLVEFLTAAENVDLAVTLAGGDPADGRARDLLEALGVAHRADDLPRRLSGGETQRVALAVALVNEPELLLADEVTAELDSANAELILEVILQASAERGLSVLLVTHSQALAALTERHLRVVDGLVVAQ